MFPEISFSTPDKTGVLEDITLCYRSLDEIRAGSVYYGATIGRCANRVANGEFTLNGETYNLEKNNINFIIEKNCEIVIS